MSSERISDAELDRLKVEMKQSFEDAVRRASYTSHELNELAARHRRLATLSSDAGQRRAFHDAAASYQREARERAAAHG